MSRRRLWERLTEPPPGVVAEEERRRARLLAGILVVLMPIALFGSTLLPRLFDPTFTIDRPGVSAGIGAGLALIPAYLLSRTTRYREAAFYTLVVALVSVFSAAWQTHATPDGVSPLYFVGIILLLAVLLVPVRHAALLLVGSLLALMAFPLFTPDLRPGAVTAPIIFVAMVGGLVLVAGTLRGKDLERLEASNARLAASEERLRNAITGAPIILYTLDREGVITFSDGQALEKLGYRGGELVGKSVFDLYRGNVEVLAVTRRALAGEAFSNRMTLGDLTLETHWSPIVGPDGTLRGTIGVSTDVTAQVRAQIATEESRRAVARSEKLSALGTLVAGVAHEINNPLASMKGTTQLAEVLIDEVLAREDLPAEARETLLEIRKGEATVGRGIDRIAHITSSLKRVAKPGSGTKQAEDVNGLVETVLTVAAPRVPPGVRVTTELRAKNPAMASGAEISQVLLNLLFNAADAMAGTTGRRITVRSFDDGGSVVVEVEDEGTGIEPAKHHLIFTPFHTTKAQGTGLGLSVSYRILEDHGGRLTFRSEAGRGTTFRVELPAAPPTAQRST